MHPSWPADQMHKRYVAEVAGLNLNANCIDFLLKTTSPGETVRYAMNPQTKFVSVANTCLTGGDTAAVWLSRPPGSNAIVLKGRTPANMGEPLSVTVHDRGEGIPEADLPRLFRKFFRRDHGRPSGTGLGLWISRGLVEAHGGTITCDSTLGVGTTFTLTLPTQVKRRSSSLRVTVPV